ADGFQKSQPLARERFRAGRQVAPYAGCGGDLGNRRPKALDHQPTAVANPVQRFEQLGPVNMSAARDAPVVLTSVDMLYIRTQQFEGAADALLLNVGVEGIEEHADSRMVHRFAQLARVLG